MAEDKYMQLVKEVFGNAKGEELLDAWQSLYGDRPSYTDGTPTEEVYAREGERRFFLIIKGIIQHARTK
jgi:hemoglobin-like flavoprotein